MNPDIFEVIMLVCFGAAWPFSIYKMLKSKNSAGKSVLFLFIIFTGYIAGTLFQYFGERNIVIFLYMLNDKYKFLQTHLKFPVFNMHRNYK